MKEVFMAYREAENNRNDYLDIMASFDYYTNMNYLDYLSVQQLEALLPAYRSDVEKRIKELIIQKRKEEDAKYNIDDRHGN